MQYYVVNGSIPDSYCQNDGYTEFIRYMEEGSPMDKFDGFELVARLHMPQQGEICVICRADSLMALQKHFGIWRAKFEVEWDIKPALTCAEMVKWQKQLNAQLDAELEDEIKSKS